jgi:hypothetical protein
MRILLAILLAVVPRLASAQAPDGGGAPAPAPVYQPPPPPPPTPPTRHGLYGGFGLFGGNISCNGTNCGNFSKGGGAAGYLGYMLSDRLGIALDIWAMTARDSTTTNDVTLTFVTGTVDVRYYLASAFWIGGGLGNGHAEVHVSIFQARSDDVPVGLIAAGFELVRSHSYAIDIAFRFAQGTSTSNNASSGDATTGRMVGLGADLTFN